MKNNEINIRDPFILFEDGTFYMYGTRAKNFGIEVGGVDVYTSTDLENWSEPKECFNSIKYGMNRAVNWAPEVHKYKGNYYMFATFTPDWKRRGTYALKAASPLGPFEPISDGPLTPHKWECLDGSLYIENDKPYLVFCHEHTQIYNGGMCFIELSDDLTHTIGEPTTLFHAADPVWVKRVIPLKHYITDGPFMYRTKTGTLLMIWSTYIDHQYAECVVRFNNGVINHNFEHIEPLITNDGGHGMIFSANDKLYLTYHTPNTKGEEHPAFKEIVDCGDHLELK